MSLEQVSQTTEVTASPHEAVAPVLDIDFHLNRLKEKYPGIEGLQTPGLNEAAASLINDFEVRPEFFEGEEAGARTLFLSSLAMRWAKIESHPANVANMREKEFIADSMFVLTNDYTDSFVDIRSGMEQEANSTFSDETEEKAIHDFTQPELTAALQDRLENSDLLTDIKVKMQLTPENQDKYEALALSIVADDSNLLQLDVEPNLPTTEDWDNNYKEASQKVAANEQERQTVSDWRKGLQAKSEKFRLATGNKRVFAAYRSRNLGKNRLILSAPIAERFAYPEDLENRSSAYKKDPVESQAAELNVVRHEFVHTQGGVNLGGVFIGINAEERRAEYFSGDKLGYQDIKYFFRDVRLATGFSITDFFDTHAKGGTSEELIAQISQELGLDAMPEIMMMPPANYHTDQSNQIYRSIVDYLGSYQGVVGRLLDKAKQVPGKMQEVDARMQEYAQLLADSPIDDDALHDLFIPAHKRVGSVHFIEDIEKKMLAIRRERGQKVPIPT